MAAFLNGIVLVDPILREVVGDDQDAEVSEAKILKGGKGRTDVGAFFHGTATAVDHDIADAWNVGRPFLEAVKAIIVRSGTDEDGSRNVRALIQGMRTDIDNSGRMPDGLIKLANQVGGLDGLFGSPRIGGSFGRRRLRGASTVNDRCGDESQQQGRKHKRRHDGSRNQAHAVMIRSEKEGRNRRALKMHAYFCGALRWRWSLRAVERSVSGTFLFIVRRFRSVALSVGSKWRVTSSGVFGLLSRFLTTT